jgi:hypothetical protein
MMAGMITLILCFAKTTSEEGCSSTLPIVLALMGILGPPERRGTGEFSPGRSVLTEEGMA